MTFISISVSDGKRFSVEKDVLSKCGYFNTLQNTSVGKQEPKTDLFVDCDSESFALIVRLLKYGIESVPDEKVDDHVKRILFHDANFLCLATNLLEHLFLVKQPLYTFTYDVHCKNLRLWRPIVVAQMHLLLTVVDHKENPRFEENIQKYISVQDSGIEINVKEMVERRNIDANGYLCYEFQLTGDFLMKARKFTLEVECKILHFTLIRLKTWQYNTISYEEFCKELIA